MQAPTLCFCVGATKAGTTWLYKFLAQHPDCHLRNVKELHFFDGLENGTAQARVARMQRMIDRAVAAAVRTEDAKALMAVLNSGDEAHYLAYLQDGAGEQRVVADITPAYGLLPVERLRKMAALLPDVKFIYLMRDPVARLWSHVRMSAHRQGGDFAARAALVFENVLAGKQIDVTDRGDYQSVLGRLDAAVDPSRLLVMFQEALMTIPGVDRLCAFLGIASQQPDFDRWVHKGQDLVMTTDQLARARVALRKQYVFAASRFGTLPDAWLRNMGEGVA